METNGEDFSVLADFVNEDMTELFLYQQQQVSQTASNSCVAEIVSKNHSSNNGEQSNNDIQVDIISKATIQTQQNQHGTGSASMQTDLPKDELDGIFNGYMQR